jgi:hypothetical protein
MLEQDSGKIYVESHNVFKKMVFAKIVDFLEKHRVYYEKIIEHQLPTFHALNSI